MCGSSFAARWKVGEQLVDLERAIGRFIRDAPMKGSGHDFRAHIARMPDLNHSSFMVDDPVCRDAVAK